ncbi:MAG: tetratricopeptide repeat protein [Candidatus Thermoplasmatota archaeon]
MSIVGRVEELRQLTQRLESAAKGSGSTVLIFGPAGIGKTALVEAVAEVAAARGFLVLRGSGEPHAMFPYQLFDTALAPHLEEPLVPVEAATKFSEIFAVTRNGLLLAHAHSGGSTMMDSDILAGMLTAVQSFVSDSFGGAGSGASVGSGLKRLEYQQKKILIEYKKSFYLAGVIEGEEHPGMQGDLAAAARRIDERFGAVLEDWNGTMARVGGIAEGLNILLQQRWRVLRSPADINLEAERMKLYERALSLVLRLSAKKPVLLLAEDLHWAEEGSLGIFLYVARNTRAARVLIVGTTRPERGEALEKMLKKMTLEELHTTLQLRGLAADETATFAATLLDSPLSQVLADALCTRSEGNPLFAKELLNAGRRDGTIVQRDGIWVLQHGGELAAASLEDLVTKRVQALDPACFHVLDLCAVLGRECPMRQLVRVLGSEEGAYAALSPLIGRSIILQTNGTLRFEHTLVRETVYKLAGPRRCAYHRHVAEIFEIFYAKNLDEMLYEIAHHYSNSDVPAKALEYCERAGDKAVAEHAVERAATFYGAALDAIAAMPVRAKYEDKRLALLEKLGDICALGGMYDRAIEAFSTAAAGHKDEEARARMHRKHGEVLDKKGDFEAALAEVEAGKSIVPDCAERWRLFAVEGWVRMHKGEYEDSIRLSKSVVHELERFEGTEKDVSIAYSTLGMCYWHKGDYDEALGFFGKSLRIAEKVGDERGLAAAYNNLGNVLYHKGEYDKALGFYEKSVGITMKIGDQRLIAGTHSNIGGVLSNIGEYDRALEFFEKGLRISERIGDQVGIAATCGNIGVIFYYKGEHDKALEHHEKSMRIAEKIGDQIGCTIAYNNIGDLARERGDTAKAAEWFLKSMELARKHGIKVFLLDGMLGLVETYIAEGSNDLVPPLLCEAEKMAVNAGIKQQHAYSLRLRGMLLAAQKDYDGAEENFAAALRGCEELKAETEAAKTRYEWGRMLCLRAHEQTSDRVSEANRSIGAKGDVERGKGLLEQAHAVFEKRGMKMWAERCRDALLPSQATHEQHADKNQKEVRR